MGFGDLNIKFNATNCEKEIRKLWAEIQTLRSFIYTNVQQSTGSDELVKVSGNDFTAGYLSSKLLAGTGISLDELNDGGNENLLITNLSPDLPVILNAGSNVLVTGSYPEFTISSTASGTDELIKVSSNDTDAKYLSEKLLVGTGLSITENNDGSDETLTVVNTAPDQVVTLTQGSNVTITGTYPNFTIAASGGAIGTDELIKVSANDTTAGYLNGKLIAGAGITLTENNNGANETFSVAHSDTSSVSNLDTSTAQVIDTLTFDTFGHVQTVTTRNLTLADLGYTVPNAMRFGFSGEDDTANENRIFALGTNILSLRSNGNTNYFEIGGGVTNPYFESFVQGPSSESLIGMSPGFVTMYAASNSNFYFSLTATGSFNKADLASSRIVAGTWVDTKYESFNTGDPTTSYIQTHLEVWQGTPGTASEIRQDINGIHLHTSQQVGANPGDYAGLQVLPTSDIKFDKYPDTRNDGTTTKALYTDASGNIKLGTISGVGGGGITRTIISTSGSITLANASLTDYVYLVTGAHTMSMPAAAGNTNRYTIKNNHSANITIDTVGAETIEGVASISIAPESSVDIISDNTNWYII